MNRISQQNLGERVANVLREAILDGEFKAGQRLNEPDLAKRLSVSLTPVREALNSLAASGLVVRNGRQGTHVRKLDARDIENLLSVREVLEVLAVRQAIGRLRPEDDERFSHLLMEQAQATIRVVTQPEMATARLADLNESFHGLILARTGNAWLTAMLTDISDLLLFARIKLRRLATPERRRASLAQHEAIAQGLRARDPDLAARHMAHHVRQLKEHLMALLPSPDDGPAATEEGRNAAADAEFGSPGETAGHKGGES